MENSINNNQIQSEDDEGSEIGNESSFDNWIELQKLEDDLWVEVDDDIVNLEDMYFNDRIGVNSDVEIDYDSPLSIFSTIFTRELCGEICKATNEYYFQKTQEFISKRSERWKNFEIDHFYKFISCLIIMGIHRLPDINDHFSSNIFLRTPVSDIITKNKFLLWLRYFHLPVTGTKTLNKVSSVMDYLVDKWNLVYSPGQDLALDEGTIPFKGRTKLKMYDPKKPEKWGLKMWMLCEADSGYCLNIKICEGKNSGCTPFRVVNFLLNNYQNKNHIIYFDSYFASPSLVLLMKTKGFGVVATCKNNRKNLPSTISKNTEKGEVQVFCYDNDLLNIYWHDKKRVTILATVGSNLMISNNSNYNARIIPLAVSQYNRFTHGCDKSNQMCSYYSFIHKTVKYWKNVFIRLLEITIVNSYVIHKKYSTKTKTHKEFRLQLVDELLKSIQGNKSIRKFKIVHEQGRLEKRRNCHCSTSIKRVTTSFYCTTCYRICNAIIPLCDSCFKTHK